MEVYVGTLGKALQREIRCLYLPEEEKEEINVVIVLQDSNVNWIEDYGLEEKDACLEKFYLFASSLKKELSNYWCEYFDPSSGLPVISNNCIAISELDICTRVLRLPYTSVGGCGILSHSKFGQSVYPSTFITTAPLISICSSLENLQSLFSYSINSTP